MSPATFAPRLPGYKKPGITYLAAIDQWLALQRHDVVYALVGFLRVPLGQAPRVYIARPPEIAAQLKAQCLGRGYCALQEDSPTDTSPKNWTSEMLVFATLQIGSLNPRTPNDLTPRDWQFLREWANNLGVTIEVLLTYSSCGGDRPASRREDS